jgi:hypothetical protein
LFPLHVGSDEMDPVRFSQKLRVAVAERIAAPNQASCRIRSKSFRSLSRA